MRPANRWDDRATNLFVAAIYGAAVALVVAYGLSYLFQIPRDGVISGPGAWDSPRLLMRAALNVYASQHVTLVSSGGPEDMTATITFPLTLWASIPVLALVLGGFVAGRARAASGRWGMVASSFLAACIYVGVLAALCGVISAKFTSAALPAIRGTEFNPPDMPFGPSLTGTLGFCSLFAILFTYLGALLAVRGEPGPAIQGKWWACAKAIVAMGLGLQLVVAAGLWVWFSLSPKVRDADNTTNAKVAELLPTAAGMGYALVHSAKLSYEAAPVDISGDLTLYDGTTSRKGEQATHKPPSRYALIAAAIGALMALLSGRLAVKWGSRDGSLPTAIRIAIIQAAYVAALMALCSMGWGMAGQPLALLEPRYSSCMLFWAAGVFVLSGIGAHWANRRYAGRLSGFPAV